MRFFPSLAREVGSMAGGSRMLVAPLTAGDVFGDARRTVAGRTPRNSARTRRNVLQTAGRGIRARRSMSLGKTSIDHFHTNYKDKPLLAAAGTRGEFFQVGAAQRAILRT